jgi:hypothetical protein
MYVQLQKSLRIYHRKHEGRIGAVAVFVLFVLSMLLRAAWWGTATGLGRGGHAAHRARQARAALQFHLFGVFPKG